MKTIMVKGDEHVKHQDFHCPFCGCEFVSDEFMIRSYDRVVDPVNGIVRTQFEATDECPNCGYRIVKEPEGVVSDGD